MCTCGDYLTCSTTQTARRRHAVCVSCTKRLPWSWGETVREMLGKQKYGIFLGSRPLNFVAAGCSHFVVAFWRGMGKMELASLEDLPEVLSKNNIEK